MKNVNQIVRWIIIAIGAMITAALVLWETLGTFHLVSILINHGTASLSDVIPAICLIWNVGLPCCFWLYLN